MARAPVFNAVPRGNVPTHTRLAASGDIAQLMPCASLRSPSATPPTSPSPVRASPDTGFRFPPCPVSVTPRTPLPEPPTACFARLPSPPSLRLQSTLHLFRSLSDSGAARDDADRRCAIASRFPSPALPPRFVYWHPHMAVRQSSTPCPAATSRHPHGSPPPATSPSSRRPPRLARRPQRRPRPRRWLRPTPAFASSSSSPVTPFMFTMLPTMTAMSAPFQ